MGKRPLPDGVPVDVRGGEAAHLGLGDEEYEQPQRSHTEEVLPGSARMFAEVRPAQWGRSPPKARDLRQGSEEATG